MTSLWIEWKTIISINPVSLVDQDILPVMNPSKYTKRGIEQCLVYSKCTANVSPYYF